MKHLYIVFNITTLLIISTLQLRAQDKDADKLSHLMNLSAVHWNNSDIEAYVDMYAPDDSTRMIYNGGTVYGKKDILAFYKKYWPREKMGKLRFTGMAWEKLSPIFYFGSGYFHVQQSSGKEIKGRYTILMKKIGDQWYFYTDHSAN